LVANSIVWDMTIPWGNWGRKELKHAAVQDMRATGYTVASLTVASDDHDLSSTISAIAQERILVRDSDDLILVETVEDVKRAHDEGKLGLSFHFQGTVPVGRDLNLVETYYNLGVRHMLLAYNQKNFVGDGCHELTDAGLSRFGGELIKEMERVGMLLDVSHTGYRTCMDAFETATAPVIFSHSNPKSVYDHPRNITDDQIRACVASRGVIGVNGVGIFMGDATASSETLFKCVDYLAELAGPEHVGLGLDSIYDLEGLYRLAQKRGRTAYPEDGGYETEMNFAKPSQVVELTALMLSAGYTEDQIKGILGQNWLRVCEHVWK